MPEFCSHSSSSSSRIVVVASFYSYFTFACQQRARTLWLCFLTLVEGVETGGGNYGGIMGILVDLWLWGGCMLQIL